VLPHLVRRPCDCEAVRQPSAACTRVRSGLTPRCGAACSSCARPCSKRAQACVKVPVSRARAQANALRGRGRTRPRARHSTQRSVSCLPTSMPAPPQPVRGSRAPMQPVLGRAAGPPLLC